MSRTRSRNRSSSFSDELRPDKSYKRLNKHILQKEYELA